MKKLFLIACVAFLGFSQTTHAANDASVATEQKVEGKKFAILVQSVKNLRSSIMTGTEIMQSNPNASFEIVIMGQMVQDLAKDPDLHEAYKAAEKFGVKLIVCEFAMKVYGVEMSTINPYIKGTPNAHKYMFQLQENGYNVLSI